MTKNNRFRKPLIAGNWKMNKTVTDAVAFIDQIKLDIGKQLEVSVAVFPPFTALESTAKAIEGSHILLGAQNMHPSNAGAYTGEISAPMLRQLFVSLVILGHSERRTYFGETDSFINEKVHAALTHHLRPILCVGETLAEREAGQTLAVVKRQIEGGLTGVSASFADSLFVAYEPVWAIGTGKSATTEMAQEVHQSIRQLLTNQWGSEAAQKSRILYGGSMSPNNAKELLAQPDIDGGLVGGASLNAKSFVKLVELAQG